jgi:hypothetical protein
VFPQLGQPGIQQFGEINLLDGKRQVSHKSAELLHVLSGHPDKFLGTGGDRGHNRHGHGGDGRQQPQQGEQSRQGLGQHGPQHPVQRPQDGGQKQCQQAGKGYGPQGADAEPDHHEAGEDDQPPGNPYR